MSDYKISVIIPVYKVDKYLRQCLDSVINQTLKDIEIIIVDEGELDECRRIIDEYEAKDERIKTIHEKNWGYGASVNKGINKAVGEYISIIESDDTAEPNMLEDLYSKAVSENAEVVKSNFYNYYETEPSLCYWREILPKKLYNKTFCPLDENDIFYSMNTVWSAIYKREFLNEYNIRFTDTPKAYFVDIGFSFKVWVSAKRVHLLKDAYIHYRQDNENASVRSKDNAFCVCNEYRTIDEFIKNNPNKVVLDKIKNKTKFNDYMWNLRRISNKYKKEFIKKMSDEFKKAIKNKEVDFTILSNYQQKEYTAIANHPLIYLLKHQWTKII
ncbi:MAG: glycosyltransferase [bacterium]|nr:glycosyltransferase [bacterium]